MKTTSHYPHRIKLFPKLPKGYEHEAPVITVIKPPVLNNLGMKLAGF
jgi:hypothetical protein